MKIDNPELMGQAMRERRKTLGFTIAEMAQAVGVSPITIMRLELGRLSYVHERTAKLLEVPKKVIKRMVMEPVGVGAEGNVLPASTLVLSPNARDREMAPSFAGREIRTGDSQTIRPKPPIRAPRAKLEPARAIVMARGQGHTASPLRKFFLWMAEHV